MSPGKRIRRDVPQLLEAHASSHASYDLYQLLNAARRAARSGVEMSRNELRLMVGLDASAPAVALARGETGRLKFCLSYSLAAAMAEINEASGEEVFTRPEIVATVKWEHSA